MPFFMSFISFLEGESQSGTMAMLMQIVPFILIIFIFYFFLIRPQNKQRKKTEEMIAALKKGDKVVTIGGIHGVVSSTKEKTVVVKVDDNCKIEFSRSAIANVENNASNEAKKDISAESAEEKK